MLTINIGLVILGMAIPIGTAIFWSKAAKILGNRFENKSHGTVLNDHSGFNLVRWLYRHKSKFNVLMAALVTIIEFLALMSF